MLKYKFQYKTSVYLYVFQDCRVTEIIRSEIIWSVVYIWELLIGWING
jgi:hypothetical protein